jgi:hypothetical protein
MGPSFLVIVGNPGTGRSDFDNDAAVLAFWADADLGTALSSRSPRSLPASWFLVALLSGVFWRPEDR